VWTTSPGSLREAKRPELASSPIGGKSAGRLLDYEYYPIVNRAVGPRLQPATRFTVEKGVFQLLTAKACEPATDWDLIQGRLRRVRSVRPNLAGILGAATFQTALLMLLPYFPPRKNNDIANLSLSGSQKGSNLRKKCARIRWAVGLRQNPLGV